MRNHDTLLRSGFRVRPAGTYCSHRSIPTRSLLDKCISVHAVIPAPDRSTVGDRCSNPRAVQRASNWGACDGAIRSEAGLWSNCASCQGPSKERGKIFGIEWIQSFVSLFYFIVIFLAVISCAFHRFTCPPLPIWAQALSNTVRTRLSPYRPCLRKARWHTHNTGISRAILQGIGKPMEGYRAAAVISTYDRVILRKRWWK